MWHSSSTILVHCFFYQTMVMWTPWLSRPGILIAVTHFSWKDHIDGRKTKIWPQRAERQARQKTFEQDESPFTWECGNKHAGPADTLLWGLAGNEKYQEWDVNTSWQEWHVLLFRSHKQKHRGTGVIRADSLWSKLRPRWNLMMCGSEQ